MIAAAASVLRLGAAVYFGDVVVPMPGVADQVSYHALALRVLDGHGFSFGTGWWPATPANAPTAHWSFLYVLFLSAVYGLAGPSPLVARLVQALAVSVLHPWLTFALGSRLFGRRVGLVSAAVAAGYAYFVYYAGALMTESFCVLSVLWALVTAIRIADAADSSPGGPTTWQWIQLGVALASGILLRQVVLFVAPVVLAWVAWRVARAAEESTESGRAGRSALGGLIVVSGVVCMAIAPWTARNYRVFDRFVLLNTNAGFAFFWGNHPVHGSRFLPLLPGDGSLYGQLIPDELRSLNEGALDRALLQRGLQFVAADPLRYARLSVGRVREYVKFWPSAGSGAASNYARVLSFGICLPFMVAGVVLALAGRPDVEASPGGVGLVLASALVYSLMYVLTWTLVRYRLPVDALLVPFAALSMTRSRDRVRQWLARPASF